MKKRLNKFLGLTLACTLLMSLFAGCQQQKEEQTVFLPDYSTTEETLDFFAYRPLSNGTYYIDNVEYTTGDLRTEENYQIFKDAGFTMSYVSAYAGTTWESSDTKKEMDMLAGVGIDKVIFADIRLNKVDNMETVEEAVPYVKECLATYIDEPNFYGLSLGDEPAYTSAEDYGRKYKAVKQAAAELGKENIYIHVNFLPIDAGACNEGKYAPISEYESFTDAYEFYIESFLKAMEPDRISVDIYFFRGSGLYPGTYANLQILTRLCKEYNTKLTFCLQSFDQYSGNNEIYSRVDKSMMRMELESLLGMGIDNFAYFTYRTPNQVTISGNKHFDGSSFITLDGTPTNIYYYGQALMASAKKFQNVILNYDYQGCKMYTSSVANFNNRPYVFSNVEQNKGTSISFDNSYEFALLKDFSFNNDVAFISELKDEKNDLYMYMVQNVVDPRNGKYGNTEMTVDVNFGAEYKWVAEFDVGELTYVTLNNGAYKKTLSAGCAVYLIPLK